MKVYVLFLLLRVGFGTHTNEMYQTVVIDNLADRVQCEHLGRNALVTKFDSYRCVEVWKAKP